MEDRIKREFRLVVLIGLTLWILLNYKIQIYKSAILKVKSFFFNQVKK